MTTIKEFTADYKEKRAELLSIISKYFPQYSSMNPVITKYLKDYHSITIGVSRDRKVFVAKDKTILATFPLELNGWGHYNPDMLRYQKTQARLFAFKLMTG